MPRINRRTKKLVTDYMSQEIFEQIFPYAKASSVFTHDNSAFWRYQDFVYSVAETGLGTENQDDLINKLEIAAFFGNLQQETGSPSLSAPYPWSWPKAISNGADYNGPAGGCLSVIEGAPVDLILGETLPPAGSFAGPKIELSDMEKQVLQTQERFIQGYVQNIDGANQPGFGLPSGSRQDGHFAVSGDGNLWGQNYPFNPPSDPKFVSTGVYSQYGGRGAIQLSYNYNYSDCSKALFDDYRLVQYPNLIITTDPYKFLGLPRIFGFPGPNPGGDNQLPTKILETTPHARIMAWLVCVWFWNSSDRSGRTVSCHQAMQDPNVMGITTVNAIVNNQSGLVHGTWAYLKNVYYRRVCRILGIPEEIVERSIVSPPSPQAKLKPGT